MQINLFRLPYCIARLVFLATFASCSKPELNSQNFDNVSIGSLIGSDLYFTDVNDERNIENVVRWNLLSFLSGRVTNEVGAQMISKWLKNRAIGADRIKEIASRELRDVASVKISNSTQLVDHNGKVIIAILGQSKIIKKYIETNGGISNLDKERLVKDFVTYISA